MASVDPIDYKRAHALERRTINVDVPAELVAKKGRTQRGHRRCRQAETALREAIGAAFHASGRRQYRSDVAVHLALGGLADIGAPEGGRTVKAVVDAMKGPVFADDRAVGLLEVSSMPGPLSARISVCSVGEYADTYDVLGGVCTSSGSCGRRRSATSGWPPACARRLTSLSRSIGGFLTLSRAPKSKRRSRV